ncbi:MAG TPA: hypothetical protein PKH07_17070, partial [bacterium]|nr:hypothetical protein [bacterium]
HHVVLYPPMDIGDPSEGEQQRVERVLNELNRLLESEIRSHPTEWAWMHRRWRQKPSPETNGVTDVSL